LNYTINLANLNSTDTVFYVRDPLPTNLSYVPGSVSSNASYNAADNQIEATIPLAGQEGVVSATDFGGFFDLTPYKAIDLDNACGAACDDTAFSFTGMNFTYFGTAYNRIGIASNGFLQAGGATSATASTQMLPVAGAPNNVIAPLWTDLNLDASGDWFYAAVTDGVNDYDVFQWTAVPHFDTPTDLYTFQVWIVYGTDMIFFSYAPLPAGLLNHNTEIGIENPLGTVGDTYFNVTGTTVTGVPPNPASATPDLAVETVLDSAAVTYQAMVDVTDLTIDKVFNVVEVAYDNSTTVDLAFAKTLLVFFKTWYPIVFK